MGFLGLSRRSKLGELVAGIAGRRPIGLRSLAELIKLWNT